MFRWPSIARGLFRGYLINDDDDVDRRWFKLTKSRPGSGTVPQHGVDLREREDKIIFKKKS